MSGVLSKALASITGKGVSSVVESIGELFTSDEERMEEERLMKKVQYEHEQEMKKLDIKEQNIYLKDVDSARVNQSRVQEAEHASWLSKNVQPILAIVVTAACFIMFYDVMQPKFKFPEENKDVIIYVLGILSSVVVQIMSYFFGSSKSSSDKNAHMFSKKVEESPVVVKKEKPKLEPQYITDEDERYINTRH